MSFLKTKDVATVLNVSGQTIRTLIDKGELTAVRVGGQLRIDEGALNRYIEAQTNTGCKTPASDCREAI